MHLRNLIRDYYPIALKKAEVPALLVAGFTGLMAMGEMRWILEKSSHEDSLIKFESILQDCHQLKKPRSIEDCVAESRSKIRNIKARIELGESVKWGYFFAIAFPCYLALTRENRKRYEQEMIQENRLNSIGSIDSARLDQELYSDDD